MDAMSQIGSHLRVSLALVAFTIISIIYFLNNDQEPLFLVKNFNSYLQGEQAEGKRGYLVWSPSCRIEDVDPWHKSIQKYVSPTTPVVCSKDQPLTYIERRKGVGNVLRINLGLISKYKLHKKHKLGCCFSTVSRDFSNRTSADSTITLSSCKHFEKEFQFDNLTEFVLVTCRSNTNIKLNGKIVYQNIHAMVPIIPRVEKKLNIENKIQDTNKRLNVLIIGIDSVSRLNLRRTMPQTLSYLQRNKWVELHGYNKIADNTFPNLMAILSGEEVNTLQKKCARTPKEKLDDCPYIWKEFSNQGFVTAYAEDVPTIGTFNYMRGGFVKQPTDYYLRPFMLAAHEHLRVKNKDGLAICVGPNSVADHIFGYAKDFSNTFMNHSFFGLFWLNSFSHNNLNSPGALDLKLMNFLIDITNLGIIDNTAILLLSDHGMRFGNIRETFIGYLEERLPFIFIRLPKWFREEYPHKFNNLLINKHRLTTPYDIYLTLKEILHLETDQDNIEDNYININYKSDVHFKANGCPKCRSLFQEQEWDRSCKDAAVLEHWCMCHKFKEMPINDPVIVKAGQFLYNTVVNRTRDLVRKEDISPGLCSPWEMSRIIRAHKSEPYQNTTSVPVDTLVIIVQLDPNEAIFEATIRLQYLGNNNTKFEILGFISRLDYYFYASKCVKTALLKFYCMCK